MMRPYRAASCTSLCISKLRSPDSVLRVRRKENSLSRTMALSTCCWSVDHPPFCLLIPNVAAVAISSNGMPWLSRYARICKIWCAISFSCRMRSIEMLHVSRMLFGTSALRCLSNSVSFRIRQRSFPSASLDKYSLIGVDVRRIYAPA